MIAMFIIFGLIFGLGMFALLRNEFVYRTRMDILNNDSEDFLRKLHARQIDRFDGHPNYDALPSYEKMFCQFWKWKY